jgi:hypothetical protein
LRVAIDHQLSKDFDPTKTARWISGQHLKAGLQERLNDLSNCRCARSPGELLKTLVQTFQNGSTTPFQ